MTLTVARLKELLSYDPETGVFVWRVKTGSKAMPGYVAGSLNAHNGYRYLKVDKRAYREHRLVWFYVHGEWPADQIDHINLVKDDNRICNLRAATQLQNNANRLALRNSRSGAKGIWWYEKIKSWRVRIRIDGKRVTLGYCKSKDEAIALYQAAAKHHFGDFARAS